MSDDGDKNLLTLKVEFVDVKSSILTSFDDTKADIKKEPLEKNSIVVLKKIDCCENETKDFLNNCKVENINPQQSETDQIVYIKREPSVEFELILPPPPESTEEDRILENIKHEPPVEFKFMSPQSSKVSKNLKTKKRQNKFPFAADRQFKCELCLKSFLSLKLIDMHMMKTHLNLHFYSCGNCQFTAKSRGALNKHLVRHNKSFRCPTCQKLFARVYEMNEHQAKHTTEKTIPCEVCPKMFKNRHSMREHLRNMHCKAFSSINNKLRFFPFTAPMKTFQCSKCDRHFGRSSYRNRHEREHAREECPRCHQFLHKRSVQAHLEQPSCPKAYKLSKKR